MNVIPAIDLGIKNADGKLVVIDDMMGNSPMNLKCNKIGILIDDELLQKRLQYGWFLNQSKTQVLESDINISKYLLMALKV